MESENAFDLGICKTSDAEKLRVLWEFSESACTQQGINQ